MNTRRSAFTLLEVMVAVAVLGLASAASLRLLTMSARAVEQVRHERRNLSLARSLWLQASYGELKDRGRESDYSWVTERFSFDRQQDVPEGFYCRKVVLSQGDPMSRQPGIERNAFVFYVPDLELKKERKE